MPDSISNGSYGGGSAGNGVTGEGTKSDCSGTIQTKWNWVPTTGKTITTDPPPTQVIIMQTCGVSAGTGVVGSTWSYSTGLGKSGSGTFNPQVNPATSGGSGTDTKYFVMSGGATVTLPALSASATVSAAPSSASLSYTAAILSAVVSLGAHSTVDTSATGNPWDPTKPRFFSGTNCSATATAPAVSGHVTQAQLLVGGTDVKDYYDTAFPGHPAAGPNVILGTNQTSTSLSVHFDSTHFSDASSVPIQMTVTDSAGNNYSGTIQANAYNKAYTLGNYQPTGGSLIYGLTAATNASSAFTSMKHTSTPLTTAGKSTILANLPSYTAFYIWTHGLDLPSVFGDCFAAPNSPDTNLVYAYASDDSTGSNGVIQAVALKSVSVPPYNFAFCDACLTSQNNLMAGAFGVTTSSVDQAYLGFTTEADDTAYNASWSNRVFTNLSNGFGINDAVKNAITVIGYPMNNGQHATTYVWGDAAAKLHGVYNASGTQWFK